MEPNDLPIIVLPLNLSDESAAILIAFLHNFADALERHYAAQLMRYTQSRSAPAQSDPPF